MNEIDFSQKLTSYLDVSASQISAVTRAKLQAARERALATYRPPVRILGLVTVSGRLTDPSLLVRNPLVWLPILLIVALLFALQPNSADDLYDETGVIDAKLLTGELPIDAFLDKDFATWVQEQEATPQ
ncbi:MAG: DUF3619 family protein [Aeromicrobium sp.]|nr:DUF3619 family protein [Burkholderiales bacterium]